MANMFFFIFTTYIKRAVYTLKVLTENLLNKNFVKVIPFTRWKFDQIVYPKLPFGGKFKDKQKIWIPKRCFDWSIPIKVRKTFKKNRIGFYSSKFLMENFDGVTGL